MLSSSVALSPSMLTAFCFRKFGCFSENFRVLDNKIAHFVFNLDKLGAAKNEFGAILFCFTLTYVSDNINKY